MEKPVRNAIRSLVDLSWQQRMDLDMEETRRIIILVTVDAAQNCLKNFESVYNKDSRPRDAISAAIACGNDPSPEYAGGEKGREGGGMVDDVCR